MKKVKFANVPEIKIYTITNEYDDNDNDNDNSTLWENKVNAFLSKTTKIILYKIDFNINNLWEKILVNNPNYLIITSRKSAIEFIISIIQIITSEYNNNPLKIYIPLIKYSTIYAAAAYYIQVKCNINQNLSLEDIKLAQNIKGIVGCTLSEEYTMSIQELGKKIDSTFPI